jgi:hypothetical protein
MKAGLKKLFEFISAPLDFAMMLAAFPSALVLYSYRRVGSKRLPRTTRILKGVGMFPILNHYSEPLFKDDLLNAPLNEVRLLPGVDFKMKSQRNLLKTLNFQNEFVNFVESQENVADAGSFTIDNGSFEYGDADFLFQIVRQHKPRKFIEIGSGSSTKVARHALALNKKMGNVSSRHLCIEPFEQPWLDAFEGIELVRDKVEHCNIDWANELTGGDILFIDSSHVIRPQGDVLLEYLNIIPLLSSGVLVHVHDIFSPRDYPEDWVRKDVKFWNEQYLLEATLGNAAKYEVVASLNHLKHEYFDELRKVCPFLKLESEPGSFYFKVK